MSVLCHRFDGYWISLYAFFIFIHRIDNRIISNCVQKQLHLLIFYSLVSASCFFLRFTYLCMICNVAQFMRLSIGCNGCTARHILLQMQINSEANKKKVLVEKQIYFKHLFTFKKRRISSKTLVFYLSPR